ncbi:MAG: metallophosphoesterase family protein [Thermoanaerobaculia bacterium]|nr:metallophosphoesterase family protein [Thermoanaerobaculia bacterium]
MRVEITGLEHRDRRLRDVRLVDVAGIGQALRDPFEPQLGGEQKQRRQGEKRQNQPWSAGDPQPLAADDDPRAEKSERRLHRDLVQHQGGRSSAAIVRHGKAANSARSIAVAPPPTPQIGVFPDTHGLLRPEALDALRGSRLIVHAGDVGNPEILAQLRELAPVVAVRGNIDHGTWAEALPAIEVADLDPAFLYMLHDLHELDLDPAAAGMRVVITDHTHQPKIEERGGVLYLDPGSAGRQRFKLPVTLARLWVDGAEVAAEILELWV